MRIGLITSVICWVLSGVVPANAQAPALRGHVADENGLAVAGAEVVITAANGQKQTARSDAAGNCEIPSLGPPPYHVTITKPGFFVLTEQPLEEAKEISFMLSHEYEMHESTQVVAPSEQIDPQQTDQQQTLEAHQIVDLPLKSTHDLQTYLPSLPGVIRDSVGLMHVDGSRSNETAFLLDCFEVSDVAGGNLTSRVAVDSVRTVEINTGAYGAQWAHGGAGVMALNTYLGDDHWRFGMTNFIPAVSLQQGLNFGNWYPRFTVSGPLEKGRAWFSDAVSVQHTFSVISGLPKSADTDSTWAGDNWLRTQYNITPTHILQGNFLINKYDNPNAGLGILTPLSTTADFGTSRYFVSAKDQIAFAAGLFEFGAAFDRGASNTLPLGSLPYVATPTGATGNYFETLRQQRRRWQTIANLLLASRNWHGRHDVRAGFNLDSNAFGQQSLRNPILTEDATQALILLTSFSGPNQFRLTDTQAGGYVQDSWRPFSKLVVQAGGRADWNGIVGRTLWAPRIAANILPFAGGRTKLNVGWGMYYQPPELALFGLGLDQQRIDTFNISSGLLAPVTSRFVVPAGLRQPYFDTTSVGLEQEIGEGTFVVIRGVVRNEHDGLAYEFRPATPQGLGGLFVMANNRLDQYRSVEFSVRHSFGNAEIFGDYIRSRARSNEVLDYSLTNPLSLLASPEFSPQAAGALPWDAPNRFISYGWTPVPFWGLLLSYHLEYRTGFPFGLVTPYRQLSGASDQFRFSAFIELDFGIEKRFHFHGHEWAARLAVVNLTDHLNADSVNNIVGSPRVFAGGQGRAFTARIRLVGKK